MNKRQLKRFKNAVIKGTEWLGEQQTARGRVEVGINGDFEVRRGYNFIEIRDKKSIYRFSRRHL